MDQQLDSLQQTYRQQIERLWAEVTWKTPRPRADAVRREALQAGHAFHRAANPAYGERCRREGIGPRLELEQLPAVAFPEEVFKAYAERTRGGGDGRDNGRPLGAFCERDAPLLLEHLNGYLAHPISSAGLAADYMRGTNLRGGLDRLRADLLRTQEVFLLTSSGTTGSAFSLIPLDRESYEIFVRVTHYTFPEITDVPGHGPIDPGQHCLVSYTPLRGSMVAAFGFSMWAQGFGERAFVAIPARVETRELRWRAGVYAGLTGQVLKVLMKPLLTLGRQRTSRRGLENLIAGLKRAEALGRRTAIFANPWMIYPALGKIEALCQAEVAAGKRPAGDPFVHLAPGSVLIFGGGNKGRASVREPEIVALARRMIGGLDKVVDVWGQAETIGTALRCSEGHYHLDPHMEPFTVDGYLAYFDPRSTNRVPAILTGDKVDRIHEDPCPCGHPARYFQRVKRDEEARGSKGCAAALAEYAWQG